MSKRISANQLLFASNSLEYAETNKARQFAASWGRVFVNQMRLTLPPITQEREQSPYNQRDRSRAQLEANLSSIQAEIEAFLSNLRKTAPQYAAIAYPQQIKISTLPIRKGEIFVEFKMTDDSTYVWAIENRDGNSNDLVAFL